MSSNLYDGVDIQVLRSDVNALQATGIGSSQYAQALANATHVYVSTTTASGAAYNGSDANSGLSVSQPKATLAGVWSLLPMIQKGAFVVHMDKVNLTWSNPPPNIKLNDNCFILFVGDGPNATITNPFTIAAGSTPTVLKTSGLTTDAYVGWSFVMASGAAAGCRGIIASHSATDLRVAAPLKNAAGSPISIAAGDSCLGFRTVAWISFPQPTTPDQTVTIDPRIHFIQVTFSPVGSAPVNVRCSSVMYGVELVAYVTLIADRVQAGTCDSEFLAALLVAQTGSAGINKNQWEGWGLTRTLNAASGAGNFLDVAHGSTFVGYCASKVAATINGAGAIFRMLGGSLDGLLMAGRNSEAAIGLAYFNGANQSAIATAGDCEIAFNDDVFVGTVAATAYFGISIEGKARLRAEGNVTITGFSTGAALRLAGNGAVAINGTLSISQYANANPVLVSQNGQLVVGGNATITNTSTANCVYCTGAASAVFNAALTVNSTNASSSGFWVEGNARLSLGSASISCINNPAVLDNGMVTCIGTFTVTGVSGSGLSVSGPGATLCCKDTVSITCSSGGMQVLLIEKGARVSFSSTGATKTLTNNATSPGIAGIRCTGGAQFECTSNLTTTLGGTQSYGCDVRGGGRAFFSVQPTGVVGSLADFIVGSNPGDMYPDTALNAAYNSISAGGSLVQRTA